MWNVRIHRKCASVCCAEWIVLSVESVYIAWHLFWEQLLDEVRVKLILISPRRWWRFVTATSAIVTRYRKRNLKNLATCYCFSINTIQAYKAPSSSHVALECYLTVVGWLIADEVIGGQRPEFRKFVIFFSVDYWLVCYFTNQKHMWRVTKGTFWCNMS